MNKLLGLLLTLSMSFVVNAQVDSKKLRIGVEGAYPPFSQMGADGKLVGFDIDIANAICKEMKADCTLVTQDFDGMIPGLLAKKIDAVIASMSITEERKRSVDFSEKYYQTPGRFVAKADSKLEVTAEGLKGKRIGVQRTSIHDRFASANFPKSEIVRYGKQDDVFLDMTAGRLDGAVVDSIAAAQGFLKTAGGRGYGFIGPVFNDPKFFGVGAGIAVRKSDTELRDQLSAAIKAIRSNGAYKKIQDKYFDFDVYTDGATATAPSKKK